MSDRPMPSSFDENQDYQETGLQKVLRKLREEPLIPLGTFLTCLALYNAVKASRAGDREKVQRMFRARVGAQAFTVMAMVAGGAYYGADREKRRELVKLEAQQRAEERNAKWLKELEVRDEEEKALQDAIRRKRERIQARKSGAAAGGGGEGASTAEDGKKEGGGGVLGALSSAGGWFGTGKKKEEVEGGKEEGGKSKDEKK